MDGLDFLAGVCRLGRCVEAVIQSCQGLVHAVASSQHKHIPQVGGESY